MYSAIRLQNEVNEILRDAGITMKCPVTVNNRLTRTLGRAIMATRAGKYVWIKIEFSGDMVRRATEKSVREVLLHECAHIIANTRAGKDCGHNKYFKEVCHEIGTFNDKTSTSIQYEKAAEKPVVKAFKYEIVCPRCGVIGRYSRISKAVKDIERYRCTCGMMNLKVKTNW